MAWVARLSLGDQLGVAAVVVVLTLVGAQASMSARIFAADGRLLLRLDALEAALVRAGLPPGMAERRRWPIPMSGYLPGRQPRRFGWRASMAVCQR